MTALAAKPSHIEWQKYRFLIMDAPKSTNLHLYLRECKKHNVTDIVRVCEPTYDAAEVEAAGIAMHEMRFDDGDSPPDEVIDMWLALVNQRLANAKADDPNGPCIAVHCVAGLGRAPVLVAIALIEGGLDPIAAVNFLRERRRGAINNKQLTYLESYRRRNRAGCVCTIM